MKRTTALFILLVSLFGLALAQDYQQSPYLESQGLPPVAERLPANPAVIEPFEGLTDYGGTLRVGINGNNPGWGGLWYIAGWENLVFWTPDFSDVQPNIAESWDVSDDAREYTFHLRQGMKWSDGEPFTSADVMFYVEDILFNEELSPGGVVADWLPSTTGGQLKVEAPDEYTVKFTFVEPYGTFLLNLATFAGRQITWYPRHYLEQFHADYNETVSDLVAQEEGVETWPQLFNLKASGPSDDTNNYFATPERPTLYPWLVTEPLGTGSQVRMARNPYYWKVDPQGNQLPYIDEILGTVYEDLETRTLAMLNGDVDFVKDPGPENRALYHQAVDEGRDIYIRYLDSDSGNTNTVSFNRTTKDPVKADVFANKDFRVGLSHAINREEIIEIVHNGQGVPAQVGPLESSPLYNEQLVTQYLEYDTDLANEYLDKVLPERGADGFRLGPDGQPFSFVMTVANDLSFGTFYVQVAELLKQYFAEVGVNMQVNGVPNDTFNEALKNNNLEATVFTDGSGAGLTAVIDPRNYVPGEFHSHFGNAWYGWYQNAQDRERVEMPADVLAVRELYDNTVLTAPSTDEQIAAMQEVLQRAADEFWMPGISRWGNLYYPFSTRVGNIPETWIDGWIEGVQKITFPEQWVIRE